MCGECVRDGMCWIPCLTLSVYNPPQKNITDKKLLDGMRVPHLGNIVKRNMCSQTNPNCMLDEIRDKKMVSDELPLNYCLISIIMHVNSISNELQLSGGRKHL